MHKEKFKIMQNHYQISTCLFFRAPVRLKPGFFRKLSLVFSEIFHNDAHPELKRNGRKVFLNLEFSLRWTKWLKKGF